jgi:hypothetical protein
MRNKRYITLAAVACVALALAGIAIAKVAKSGDVSAASATFNATTVTNIVVKTCSVQGGDTYAFTRAIYTGTAVSTDARLNGPVTVKAVSILDQTTGVGAVVGDFKVDGAANAGARGKIKASLSNGLLSGIVRLHVIHPGGEFLAGANGGFTGAGGFTNASLGSGASTDSGTILSRGVCVKSIPLDW